MIVVRYFLIIVFFLSITSNSTVYAETVEFFNGAAQINAKSSDGLPIKIIVRTTKYSPSFPYRKGFGWGADTVPNNPAPSYPQSVITSVDLKAGKEDIFVPLSAYGDLANPRTISFEITQKGFRLIVNGGDAGTSYEAVLDFEGEHIKRRKVLDGEFPIEVWEETVYSFISKTDER
ncbi:MAG: hypothetical protein HY578_06155 [Nitrospinae bacterium]|nr:hypothetical protein [Nitrospinota bacterium]